MNIYVYVLVMAVTTYLIRAIPLTLLKKPIKSRFLRSFLHGMLDGHDLPGHSLCHRPCGERCRRFCGGCAAGAEE